MNIEVQLSPLNPRTASRTPHQWGEGRAQHFIHGPYMCIIKWVYIINRNSHIFNRNWYFKIYFLKMFNPHPRTFFFYCFFLEREEGGERHHCEREHSEAAHYGLPAKDRTCSLGTCSDQEPNPQPFHARDDAPLTNFKGNSFCYIFFLITQFRGFLSSQSKI